MFFFKNRAIFCFNVSLLRHLCKSIHVGSNSHEIYWTSTICTVPVLKKFILKWMRVRSDIPTNSYAVLMNVTEFEWNTKIGNWRILTVKYKVDFIVCLSENEEKIILNKGKVLSHDRYILIAWYDGKWICSEVKLWAESWFPLLPAMWTWASSLMVT